MRGRGGSPSPYPPLPGHAPDSLGSSTISRTESTPGPRSDSLSRSLSISGAARRRTGSIEKGDTLEGPLRRSGGVCLERAHRLSRSVEAPEQPTLRRRWNSEKSLKRRDTEPIKDHKASSRTLVGRGSESGLSAVTHLRPEPNPLHRSKSPNSLVTGEVHETLHGPVEADVIWVRRAVGA